MLSEFVSLYSLISPLLFVYGLPSARTITFKRVSNESQLVIEKKESRWSLQNEVNQAIGGLSTVGVYTLYSIREINKTRATLRYTLI